MAVQRIDYAELRVTQTHDPAMNTERRRQQLHSQSLLERRPKLAGRLVDIDGLIQSQNERKQEPVPGLGTSAASVLVRGVGRVDIPVLHRADIALIQQAYNDVAPEHRERFAAASMTMAERLQQALGGAGDTMPPQTEDAVAEVYHRYSRAAGAATTKTDQDKADEAMRMLVYGTEKYLRDFVDKMQSQINEEQDVRAAVNELSSMLEDWPDGEKELFSYAEYVKNEDGSYTVVEHNNVLLSKDEASSLLQKLKTQLETVGGFSVMAQMELQKRVNEHQRVNSILSNIQKEVHERMKNAIANLKG